MPVIKATVYPKNKQGIRGNPVVNYPEINNFNSDITKSCMLVKITHEL